MESLKQKPRIRLGLSVRGMMLLVLLVALGLFITERARQRWQFFRAQAASYGNWEVQLRVAAGVSSRYAVQYAQKAEQALLDEQQPEDEPRRRIRQYSLGKDVKWSTKWREIADGCRFRAAELRREAAEKARVKEDYEKRWW